MMESETSSIVHGTTEDISQDITSQSQPSHIIERGILAKKTWAHARTANEGEEKYGRGNEKNLYCVHCPLTRKGGPYFHFVTSNFRKHLLSAHKINVKEESAIVREQERIKVQELYDNLNKSDPDGTIIINHHVCRKILDETVVLALLVTLIVVRNLPFLMVEWKEFIALCQALNPEAASVLPKSRTVIPKLISERYNLYKDIVRKKLQSSWSSIHFSLDIWTSPNRHLFLGICAHFIERQSDKLSKALLALRTIGDHSGRTQFTILLPVLEDYNIVNKIGSIVGDNHGANDTLCRMISKHMKDAVNIAWDATTQRTRCIGHIINLAVQAFLFYEWDESTLGKVSSYDNGDLEESLISESGITEEEILRLRSVAYRTSMGALGKLRNIIVHSRNSAEHTAELRRLAG